MRNFITFLINYILTFFFRFGVMLVGGAGAMMAVSGCATQPPTVIIKHVVVAPDDNLLVSCDVAPPPSKETYLKDYSIGTVAPQAHVDKTGELDPKVLGLYTDQYQYLAQYARALKNSEVRESQLTELNLKHYKNLDACNKRWQRLREWKAAATKALDTPDKKE